MATEILMPALSPTMTEGNLVKWLVGQGDRVEPGDVIAEIETDKATMEVEAVDEGIVGRILVPEGSEGVAVNAVIAVLVEEGEAVGGAPSAAAAPAPEAEAAPAPPERQPDGEAKATPLARRMAALAGIELAAIAGSGAHGRITREDVRRAAGRPAPTDVDEGERRIFASPLARQLAGEAELPLDGVAGSGPEGRIVKRDIERELRQGAAPVPAPMAADPEQWEQLPGLPPFERVKHTNMRKVIARRLTESKQTVPHFYLTVDCEIDALLAARRQINASAPEGVRVSVNDFVVKALASALGRVPDANAAWTEDGLLKFRQVDVSVAVAVPNGLLTPVVRQADAKGLAAISAEMADFAARAREGRLMPEEYQGGTTSISNLGMFGIRQFDAVINPPQATILAVGAGEQRPVVKDGALAVATVMTCTLSCDHRAVDGALGARLLGEFRALVECPAAMLL